MLLTQFCRKWADAKSRLVSSSVLLSMCWWVHIVPDWEHSSKGILLSPFPLLALVVPYALCQAGGEPLLTKLQLVRRAGLALHCGFVVVVVQYRLRSSCVSRAHSCFKHAKAANSSYVVACNIISHIVWIMAFAWIFGTSTVLGHRAFPAHRSAADNASLIPVSVIQVSSSAAATTEF